MNRPSTGEGSLGFRVHSGWAVSIALAGPVEKPTILDRRRIEIADAKLIGSKQPYHAAQELGLSRAERLITACTDSSVRLAKKAVAAALDRAARKDFRISTCGVLTGSGRPLPDLAKILSSHPLLHTAEGELFRNAMASACKSCGLSVLAVKENEVLVRSSSELGIAEQTIQQHLARLGASMGPPWRQDEKLATRMAWLTLAVKARNDKNKV